MGETVPVWRWVGDAAMMREFDGPLDEANRRASALAMHLRALPGVVDAYPAARSVLVRIAPGSEPSAALLAAIDTEVPADGPRSDAGPVHTIDVAYGGSDGPDLSDVAVLCGMSERDVIGAHTHAEYRPAFFGFMPGFAYLLGLPESLNVARLASPRTSVAAGSVGIAGPYTAVYPSPTPGGWRIIGRADVDLFDPRRTPPSSLAGARVRFKAAT